MIRFCSCLTLLFLTCGPAVYAADDAPAPGVEIARIWDKAPHNAFTDLVFWQGDFYCTFRESTDHVHGTDGKIRVIRSADGAQWESVALFEREGIDLRDPKLSVAPGDRLMVLCGGSRYEGRELVGRAPMVAFLSARGEAFTEPVAIEMDPAIASDNDWLWRVTWQGDTGYGVVYQARKDDQPWGAQLVSTTDGIQYRLRSTLKVEGKPNEATVRFSPAGEMYIVVRNEDGKMRGHLGRASAPYTQWQWSEIPIRLGGPDFLFLDDARMALGTRHYGRSARTILGTLSGDGDFALKLILPSGGDTSYPGMLLRGDMLWVSYYASHEEKTAIYLAKIPLATFE